jgi:hypothetical protein
MNTSRYKLSITYAPRKKRLECSRPGASKYTTALPPCSLGLRWPTGRLLKPVFALLLFRLQRSESAGLKLTNKSGTCEPDRLEDAIGMRNWMGRFTRKSSSWGEAQRKLVINISNWIVRLERATHFGSSLFDLHFNGKFWIGWVRLITKRRFRMGHGALFGLKIACCLTGRFQKCEARERLHCLQSRRCYNRDMFRRECRSIFVIKAKRTCSR